MELWIKIYFFFFSFKAWTLFTFNHFKHPDAHEQKKRQVKTQFDSLEFSADNVNKRFIEKENNITNL